MLVIDISYSQSTNIDFVALRRAGVGGVIMKATGSNTGQQYVDSKYRWFLPRVRAAGLLAGHYHFNGYADPTSDADFFCNNILYQPGDLVALDCESESMPYWGPAKASAFHSRVKQRMGFVSDTYMSSSITKAQNWSGVVNMGSKLWVAQYGTNSGAPQGSPQIAYWPDWKLWQYTSKATISGYSGPLDANITNNNTEWAGTGATPIKEDEDVITRELVKQKGDPSGTIWYSVDRIQRYGITAASLPDYQYYIGAVLQQDAGVKEVININSFGAVVDNSAIAVALTDAQIAALGQQIGSHITLPAGVSGDQVDIIVNTAINNAIQSIRNFTYKAQ